MDEISRKVDHHEATLFYGTNGGLPLVTRMQQAEDRMTAFEKIITDKTTSTERKQNIILGAVCVGAVTMVLHYLFHIG